MIDFGTSQSPKSTRPLTTYWCPSSVGYHVIILLAHAKPGGSITPWLSIHKPVQHQSCVLRSRLN
ncbi:hypothetical protein, partial [Thiolapillus sp.]|uniref:hypothetical protein n=1 Tax=Thiolapillus sp. TaxID=2017437 RepID=UPI003AF4C960